jgi:rhomboid protease GluP
MSGEAEEAIPITADMLLGRRVDFERRMRRFPPVTAAIIAVLAAFFLLEIAADALASEEAIARAGALVREAVFAGQYWRLLSATMLHGSLDHLTGNAIALFVLGMICEHAFGLRQYVILYVASALAGSVLSMATSAGPSVGASGAIFGLQGAAIVLFYRYRDELLLRNKRIGVVLLAWAIYTVVYGLMNPLIDNGAHLGGAAGGALAGYGLHPVVLHHPPPEDHEARVRTLFVAALGAVAYTVIDWLVV